MVEGYDNYKIEKLKRKLEQQGVPFRQFYVQFIEPLGVAYEHFLRDVNWYETLRPETEMAIVSFLES